MIKNIFLILIVIQLAHSTDNKNRDAKVLSIFENKLFYKLGDVTNYFTQMLADYNDKHLGSSEWGRMLGYQELKPNLQQVDGKNGRGIKKMSMAMMPLIFHVGATSTWMLITSIMAAKSVAIGLLLLVFKIAVSSAKVASFFTLLKSKHSEHHETWAWSPHGHDRSLSRSGIPIHDAWSYSPEWSTSELSHTGYKTIPAYKENVISSHYEVTEDTFDDNKHRKADKKRG